MLHSWLVWHHSDASRFQASRGARAYRRTRHRSWIYR